jgi:hypothetical protein
MLCRVIHDYSPVPCPLSRDSKHFIDEDHLSFGKLPDANFLIWYRASGVGLVGQWTLLLIDQTQATAITELGRPAPAATTIRAAGQNCLS